MSVAKFCKKFNVVMPETEFIKPQSCEHHLHLLLSYYILKKSLTKMGGISNFQIEDAIKTIGDQDLLENLVGAFPSNYMNRFINHSAMIQDKKRKYPFIIANTDASNKEGTHWWSILDIEPRNELFYLILVVYTA